MRQIIFKGGTLPGTEGNAFIPYIVCNKTKETEVYEIQWCISNECKYNCVLRGTPFNEDCNGCISQFIPAKIFKKVCFSMTECPDLVNITEAALLCNPDEITRHRQEQINSICRTSYYESFGPLDIVDMLNIKNHIEIHNLSPSLLEFFHDAGVDFSLNFIDVKKTHDCP